MRATLWRAWVSILVAYRAGAFQDSGALVRLAITADGSPERFAAVPDDSRDLLAGAADRNAAEAPSLQSAGKVTSPTPEKTSVSRLSSLFASHLYDLRVDDAVRAANLDDDLRNAVRGANASYVLICVGLVALAGLAAAACWISGQEHRAAEAFPRRRSLQALHVIAQLVFLAKISAIIPQSYALAVELGHGAVFSGFVIGSAYMFSALSTIGTRMLMVPWEQARIRRIVLFAILVLACLDMGCAFAAEPHPSWNLNRHQRTVMLLSSRIGFGMLLAVPSLLLRIMAVKVTPNDEMVTLSLCRTCSFAIGTGAGPFVPWVIYHVCTTDLDGPALVSRTYQCMAAATVLLLVVCAWVVPHDLELLIDAKQVIDGDDKSSSDNDGEGLTQSEQDLRKSVIWHAIAIAMERGIIVSSLEAATALVLELEFHFPTYNVGLWIGVTFFAGLPLLLVLTRVRSARILSDGQLLVGLMGCALCSALLLNGQVSEFVFSAGHSWRLVLFADAVIFGCSFTANGVADGWAMKSAMAGTAWSQENYVVADGIFTTSGRFVGPPLARLLIDLGGRNLYALLQAAVAFFALVTAVRLGARICELAAATRLSTEKVERAAASSPRAPSAAASRVLLSSGVKQQGSSPAPTPG